MPTGDWMSFFVAHLEWPPFRPRAFRARAAASYSGRQLKSTSLTTAHGEPFDSPLMLSMSKHERLAQDVLVEP